MLRKYADSELRAAINKEIDSLEEQGQTVHPAWVTHAICKRHKDGLAGDYDGQADLEPESVAFWRYNGYTYTRKVTTECINERGSDVSQERQASAPFLPGFEYLQRHYVVTRDGIDVMVPTEQLTVDELKAKADQYEANSATLLAHAHELRRYAAMRESESAAASGE